MANCVYMIEKMLHFYKFTISLSVEGKHVKRYARRAQNRQADFDWLNPHSLGTISTFDSIANFA